MRIIKLSQQPRERLRVWKVAQLAGVATSETLQALSDMGEWVKGPSSYVEVPIIRAVCARFGLSWEEAPIASVQRPMPPATSGLQPLSIRPSRDNHPLMNVVSPPKGARPPAAAHRGHHFDIDRPMEDALIGNHLESTNRDGSSPALEFESWKLFGFTESEADVWRDGGLRAGQARTAADLRDAGYLPAVLHESLYGKTVGRRMAVGEDPAAVLRRLRRFKRRTG